ncbi:hypothetical protein SRIMM317S_04056 [Streptomyces rimosus subsp. rimosus]
MSPPERPTLVKRKAKRAEGSAMRKSAASASTAPAPAATPWTAAITGNGHSRMARTTWPVIRLKSRSRPVSMARVAPMISSTSPPEQKPRPSPPRTRARTDRSLDSSASRSRRSAYASKVSALSRSGRARVTVAMPSRLLTRMCCHASVVRAEPVNGLIGPLPPSAGRAGAGTRSRFEVITVA